MIKKTYRGCCSLFRDVLRKVVYGYYPIFLEYPIKPAVKYGAGKPPHEELYAIIDRQRGNYVDLIDYVISLGNDLEEISLKNPSTPTEPSWQNGWLPGLDSAMIYTLIRKYKPELYIEIGSGNSTKFARRAIKDGNLSTKIISFDPRPRAEVNQICDLNIRDAFENADLSIFKDLKENDIVFVDGSHYCFQNSDVTVFFLDILPRLPAGVIVEFHDINLPYDYPSDWFERFYNEQYLLAVWLLSNPDSVKLLSPNAFISKDPELTGKMDELWKRPAFKGIEKHGGSFWFQINY